MAWPDGAGESRVLVAPLSPTSNTGKITAVKSGSCFLSLRHPKSGSSTCYILSDDSLQELHWFKQPYCSWFLGDNTCEDGSLYISTPVDPVFVLLPIFNDARLKKGKGSGMFGPLDQILCLHDYPDYQRLIPVAECLMPLVCEVKEFESSKFFRLDDSKVLAWMCQKAHNLKMELIKLGNNFAVQDENERLKDIITLLGEYLKDDPWLTLLCKHFRLDLQEISSKTSAIEAVPTPCDDTLFTAKSIQGKKGSSGKSEQSKKLKVETNSQNIKDMFGRASRRR